MRYKTIVLLFIISFILNGCSKLNEIFNFKFPTITGIYVTTVEAPNGTGEIYGIPSYSMGDSSKPLNLISVCPNPYLAYNGLEPSRNNKYLIFINLPDTIQIEIFVGVYTYRYDLIDRKYRDIDNPIRTIHKTTKISSMYLWDLKDSNNDYITTGFYRIKFTDNQNNTQFIDTYIILPDYISACSNWEDPTGWLPKDWRYITIGRNTYNRCKIGNYY